MSLNKTQLGALALAASLMLSSSVWAAASGGGSGAGGASGAAGASGSAGTGSTSPGLSAGTGSTSPGLSAGTGSSRGNNAPANTTAATINGMMAANGAIGVNGTTGGTTVIGTPQGFGVTPQSVITPQNVLVSPTGATTGIATGVPRATVRRNTRPLRFVPGGALGRPLGATRLNTTAGNTATGNTAIANNLASLGFTGGRPVTLAGRLFDTQSFFGGASGVPAMQSVPVLQGTPISDVAGSAVANTGVSGLSVALNSPGHLPSPVPVSGLSQAINSPGHVSTPAGATTALNTGITGRSFDNFGTVAVTPSVTGGVVNTSTGLVTPAQPGIDTGTALVGANQVGLTGNTLTDTNPRAAVSSAVQSAPLQAAPVFTNAGTASAMGNLMFLQTSTGPILVANASGAQLNPTMSNIQLQGRLFQRGPFRLLVLSDTGLGNTGIP